MQLKLILVFMIFCHGWFSEARNFSYRDRKEFRSDDFLLRENGMKRDLIFNDYNIIDASIDLGVSTGGCGQINVGQTLRANLRNLLSEKTFQQMGSDLAGSSFMLLTCYWSPQLCSIMKNSRLNSSLLAGLNFRTCSAINKYVDDRASDWELSRQRCFNKALKETGGDADAAAQRCARNSIDYNLADWSGQGSGPVNANKLIESSSRWLGLDGPESRRIVDLTKAFVGDQTYVDGRLRVDFGSRNRFLSLRDYYYEQRRLVERKIDEAFTRVSSTGVVEGAPKELEEINQGLGRQVVDRSTLESLSVMPRAKRQAAIEKLGSKVAIAKVASDVSKSVDLLNAIEKNPNLPEKRKEQVRKKVRLLEENLRTTVFVESQKNEPVNQFLKRVSDEGEKYRNKAVRSALSTRSKNINENNLQESYFNCADGFMCLR